MTVFKKWLKFWCHLNNFEAKLPKLNKRLKFAQSGRPVLQSQKTEEKESLGKKYIAPIGATNQ
jgi:hypothetical protein